ncbi:MAG: hypothetical protein ACR2K6_07850 [Solirubrobacterales bacterium]
MAASIVVGVITLASVALLSSAARSAGRRARTAVTRSDRKGAPSYHELFGSAEPDVRSHPWEAGEPPRWVLALTVLSGGGLVLGLLLVMIPSIL